MRHKHCAVVVATLFFGLTVIRAEAAEQRTLTGIYMSGYQDGEEPVRAVFSPRGDDRWNVNFYFRFNGYDHVYRGTADGSLSEGELRGEV